MAEPPTIRPDAGSRDEPEEIRRLGEERFRSLVEMAADAIFLANAEGLIHYASPSVTRVLGFAPEELLGWSGLALVHPDDLAGAADVLSRTAAAPGEHVSFDLRARTRDGSWRWINGVCSNHLENPAVQAIVVNYRDVTPARLVEQALREGEALKTAMLDAALDAIVCIDHDSRIVEFNHTAERMFGYRREDVIGESMNERLVPVSRRAQHAAGMARYLAGGAPSILGRPVEMTALRADGSEFPVELAVCEIASGTPPRFVAFVRDLTDRKRAEDERRRIDAQIQQAQKSESLAVLAGGIAHDFNNLLTAILGNAGEARSQVPPGSRAAAMLGEIDQAARRASELTQQMLAYSGRGKFVIEVVRLDTLVDEMVGLLRTVVSRNAVVTTTLAPATVTADVTQVRQVIMNLITNASDALEGRGGRIGIRTGVRDVDAAGLQSRYHSEALPPGAYAFLEVSDDGSGMNDDTAARMFDPFFTTRFSGRGLGLAAVLGIVRGHRGSISVTSAPGQGTVIEVLLPGTTAVAAECPAAGPEDDPVSGQGTVLVIDDEALVRGLVQRILERAGYDVLTAEDGVEGLALLARNRAGIVTVLLDVTMPRLDGLGTLEAIRQTDQHLPVLIMSGHTSEDTAAKFSGSGASGFLQKPFASNELVARVRRAHAATCRARRPD